MSRDRSRWTPPALLARLDRALVPGLQWIARAVAWLLGWPFRTLTRGEERTRLGRALYRNRGVLLFVTVAIGFLASAVHFQRYPDLRAGAVASGPEAVAGEGTGAGPGSDDPVLGVTPQAVGPVAGGQVAPYIERRTAALDALDTGDDPVPAVVTFDEYRTPQQVLEALPGDAEVLEVQYRLPAEGERPRRLVVARDELVAMVEEAVDVAREEFADEEHEVQRLLDSDTVEDESFREDLERRLSELQALRNLLASGSPVAFAVVVRAPADDLRALSGHADVRLVDVAPDVADTEATVFYGVLPEDRDRATYGRQP